MKTNSQSGSGWRWLAIANRFLTQAYLSHSQIECQTPDEATRSLKLAHGAALRLPRQAGLRQVRVLRGTAWLTGNPEQRDEVLQTGDHSILCGTGPFVIEALSDLEITCSQVRK